ncbi:hypothetical protein O1R50_03775 [Glycomyces luteolus]|uniref:Uncharacterized protein n=1 Tax=Glycomyces luteolus TaxID=2670330 RepID=A0A9X3P713_9ACTN|nr:hypothetical protein [Glycomyces luteolus]MDA1358726.1 hypothetical protein [Glycomyces luteolus]
MTQPVRRAERFGCRDGPRGDGVLARVAHDHPRPALADRLVEPFEPLVSQLDDDHGAALVEEPLGDRPADALPAAGHDRDFPPSRLTLHRTHLRIECGATDGRAVRFVSAQGKACLNAGRYGKGECGVAALSRCRTWALRRVSTRPPS